MTQRLAFFALVIASLAALHFSGGYSLRASEQGGEKKAAEAKPAVESGHGKEAAKNASKETAKGGEASETSTDASKDQAQTRVKVITREECLVHEGAVEDLRLQREQLAVQGKEMAAREAELATKEKALEEQLKKLQELRDEIARIEGVAKQQNEAKVARIVETLEAMNPKAAAKMIATIDETLAVSAIERISTAKVAKIMNILDPEKASKLNETMAGVVRARSGKVSRRTSSNDGAVTAMNAKGGEKDERTDDKSSASQSGSIGGDPSRKPGSARP